jgi:hypothetical protein
MTKTTGNTPKEDSILYVWAVHGINLRSNPSLTSPPIKKLPYGTALVVMPQDAKRVAHQFDLFASDKISELSSESSKKQPVMLNGYWLKVKVAKTEGYVFDKLLLDRVPMKRNEELEDYMIRAFKLDHIKEKKERKMEEGETYSIFYKTFSSKKNNIVLKMESEESNGFGGSVSLPGFSFEQGILFFSALLPPISYNFEYKSDDSFEYLLDEAGNGSSAYLKKTKKGVDFNWFYILD